MVRKLSEKYSYQHKSLFLQKKKTLLFKFENNLNDIYKKKNLSKCLFTGTTTLISTL